MAVKGGHGATFEERLDPVPVADLAHADGVADLARVAPVVAASIDTHEEHDASDAKRIDNPIVCAEELDRLAEVGIGPSPLDLNLLVEQLHRTT